MRRTPASAAGPLAGNSHPLKLNQPGGGARSGSGDPPHLLCVNWENYNVMSSTFNVSFTTNGSPYFTPIRLP